MESSKGSLQTKSLAEFSSEELIAWLKTERGFDRDPYSFTDDEMQNAVDLWSLSGDKWLNWNSGTYKGLIEIAKQADHPPNIRSLVRFGIALMQVGWDLQGRIGRKITVSTVETKLKGEWDTFTRTKTNTSRPIDLLTRTQACSSSIEFYTEFKKRNLPFFAIDEFRPDRFTYTDNSGENFVYFGRKKFAILAGKGDAMNTTTKQNLYQYGTMGSGKSHIMAAYAVYLVAKGERVIFIPDCRPLAVHPLPALRKSLSLAFADHFPTLLRINKIDSLDLLRKFFDDMAGITTIYFLIDQVNALDASDPTSDRISDKQKEVARNLLDWISAGHIKIQSGTGNYQHGQGDMVREATEEKMPFYGGLDKVSSLTAI
jgi:hypothetical protein